jgi:Carboxypeptidase regulatory-like domain
MEGYHIIQSRVADRQGASQGFTGPGVWTVPPPADSTPPTVSLGPTSWVGGNSAVVKWVTNELSSTVVEYGRTTSYGTTAVSPGMVLDHAVALTGLIPNTVYIYRVRSADVAGNISTWVTGTFTTGLGTAQPIPISNTGVSAVGVPLAAGAEDTDYVLTASAQAGTAGLPARVVNEGWPVGNGAWTANSTTSKWIAPTAVQNPATAPPGWYKFQTTFSLAGRVPTTALLHGRVGADNLVKVYLNGVQKHLAETFSSWSEFVIHDGFQAGQNVLEFEVNNFGTVANPVGLRVELDGTAISGATYSVSGTVKSGGTGFAAATMTLSGDSSATATTDAAGAYAFPGLYAGNYTLTPSKSGYVFSPASTAVTVGSANVTVGEFTAAVAAPTFSPVAGTYTAVSCPISPAGLAMAFKERRRLNGDQRWSLATKTLQKRFRTLAERSRSRRTYHDLLAGVAAG